MHFGLLRIRALEAELQRGHGSAAAAALQMLPGGCCGSSSVEKLGLIPPASKEDISTLQAEPDTPSWILEPGWERSLTHCSQEQPLEWVGSPPPIPCSTAALSLQFNPDPLHQREAGNWDTSGRWESQGYPRQQPGGIEEVNVVFPEAPGQGSTWRCQLQGTEAPPTDKKPPPGTHPPLMTAPISLIPAHLHHYVPISRPIYSWSF